VLTLNQIVKKLETFANDHKQLSGNFLFGQFYDYVANKSEQYPAMIVYLQPNQLSENTDTYTFQITICDRLKKDDTNEIEVLSDTNLIAKDLITYFKNSPTERDVIINTSVTLNDFSDREDSETAGYFFDITFRQNFDYNYCDIPL
jgi:hypothetical protein